MPVKAMPDAQRSHAKRGHDRGDTLALCVLLFLADGCTRIAIVEQGIPAHVVEDLAALMDVPLNFLTRALCVPATKLRRYKRDFKLLGIGPSDRVLGLSCLIGCLAVMVQGSAAPADFDPSRWLATWLAMPVPALAGRRPAEFLSTRSGLRLIEDVLMNTSGAYV
ncbi:MAG: DUF2384 domain-containing protein [Proteobacteria bacterium]|nr:DUF2384 domain-containing protein [Pseudomonadota bacterium]